MARYKVKAGYHFIGKNRTSFKPGHVFESLTEAEVGDQAWKLEKLPSRKKDEAPGTDSMGRTLHSVVEEVPEDKPPVKSEEEIAAEEAEAARLEEERLEEEKGSIFSRKKRKKN